MERRSRQAVFCEVAGPQERNQEGQDGQTFTSEFSSARRTHDARAHCMGIQVPLLAAMEEIILYYTYPRIDAEVSKHRNHLLKAPFCVHPKTGRVCVPVDPRGIDSFDPEKVPTIGQLLGELDALIPVDGHEATPGEYDNLVFLQTNVRR